MKGRKKRRGLRLAFFLSFLFLLFFLPLHLVNQPGFQKWFLRTYKPFSPWALSFDRFKLEPWRFTVVIEGLKMDHPDGHQITVASILAKGNLLRFLTRGKLVLDPFTIEKPAIRIAKTETPREKKQKKGFKLRTLLFLQSIAVDKGKINQILLHFPDEKELTVDSLTLSLDPELIRGIRLGLHLKETWLAKGGEEKQGVREANFQFFTNLDHWSKSFPYADDIDGGILLMQAQTGKLAIEKVEAKLAFKNQRLDMKDFSVQVGGKKLLGKLESHLGEQTFLFEAQIPEPIFINELGSPIRTFNMAGDLKASVKLEGKGFGWSTSRGKGTLAATHRFQISPQYPVDADFKFQWEGGRVQIREGGFLTDNARLDVGGAIDLKPFALHLKLKASQFPIQRFFEKFADKNLHPIHGKGTLDATLDGIGPTIHLKLKGEALEGGYSFVYAEKAPIDLDITYNKLQLDGKIFSGSEQTGEADFQINYGPKTPGEARPKTISLKAAFHGASLAHILPDFPLKGKADATLLLRGPAKNFQGEGTLTAANGTVFRQGYEEINLRFKLTPKQLLIHQAEGNYLDTPFHFAKPLTLDFVEGGFKLHGSPLDGLELASQYFSTSKRWQIDRLSFREPANTSQVLKVSGFIQPASVQLRGEGTIELSRIVPFFYQLREGDGPVKLQLTLQGSFANPLLNGKIAFEENTLSLRLVPFSADDLKGDLVFTGNRIQTENLEGSLGNGTFSLRGWMTHAQGASAAYELNLNGSELYYRDPQGHFRMEYDANVSLKGPATLPTLAGSIDILDAKYTKDFNLIEELKEAPKAPREIQEAVYEGAPMALNLRVRNLGDLTIDNNIGRIELMSNVHVTGTRFTPQVKGVIEVTEGQIRYMSMDLDITGGFMEFRDPYIHPYMEIHAEKDIDDVHVTAKLHGKTSNLSLDLGGNSARGVPLEKKDVLSLILFGMTASERAELAAFQQLEFGPVLVAEQLAHVIQRPLAKFTTLDILRMEAVPTREGRIQRFFLGKRLTDRLSVEFASEINGEATQIFLFEYWFTDFLIVKGARSSEENYQMNLGFRITGR